MIKATGGNTLLDINLVLNKIEINEKMKVADLGCGSSGHFVFPVATLVGKKGIVYAVDILKTSLERINKRVKQEHIVNVKTVWSDLEVFGVTKIESGSLDIALLVNILYQSHKRPYILREAIRMLKKGGRLVVVEWKNTASPFGPPVEERVKTDLLEKAAKKLGLKPEIEFEAGPHHYGAIYLKM